jgi:hypothetical protein
MHQAEVTVPFVTSLLKSHTLLILLTTQTNAKIVCDWISQGCGYQEVGIVGSHLGGWLSQGA